MFKKTELFQGETDIGMLDKIFEVLGDANVIYEDYFLFIKFRKVIGKVYQILVVIG